MEVVDAASGKQLGQLIVDTGGGSFQVTNCFAQNDWVVVTDNENRSHIYSLTTGELKGSIFGYSPALSASAGLIAIENPRGQVEVYDLASLQKRGHLRFPYQVAAWSFSSDGKELFVMTANQVVYVFDSGALAQSHDLPNVRD